MRKTILIMLALAGLTGSANVLAEMKIGFVNTVKLMELAPQAKASASKIEKEFAPRDKKLMGMQRSIKQKEEKLTRDGAIMAEKEQTKLDREIRSEKRELKRVREEFREDLNIRRNEELGKIQRLLSKAIEDIGKQNSFDVILMENSVVFVSERIDVTDQVLKSLKQEHAEGSK